jgi:SAM-dependent methyltransferase
MSNNRFEAFAKLLLARLTPGSRVLEIGCGAGELATLLADRGHDVTAIDRNPRPEFPAIAQSFETFDPNGRTFDCVIAMLVLHHIDDLDETLADISSMLDTGGLLAIDDYGWERRDEDTAQALAWRKDREDLHTSVAMLAALDREFDRILVADHAYFDEGLGTDRLGFTYFGTPRAARSYRRPKSQRD